MRRFINLKAPIFGITVVAALFGIGLEIQSEERTLGAPVIRVSSGSQNPFTKIAEVNGERKYRPMLKVPFANATDIKVAVKVTRECFFGDMEAIYLETGWSEEKTVRVSLESLDPQTPFSTSKEVGVKDLGSSKFETSFTLPLLSKPVPLGLFICKDSAKSGSCADKAVQKSEEIFARYDPRKSPDFNSPEFKKISDKNYFFGHLVGLNDGVELTDGALTEKGVAQLQSSLGGATRNESLPVVERIKKLHDTLGSVPLSVKDSVVEITLPSLTDKGCG